VVPIETASAALSPSLRVRRDDAFIYKLFLKNGAILQLILDSNPQRQAYLTSIDRAPL